LRSYCLANGLDILDLNKKEVPKKEKSSRNLNNEHSKETSPKFKLPKYSFQKLAIKISSPKLKLTKNSYQN
jgi:hypothetical protein